jgi:hypothetical protein
MQKYNMERGIAKENSQTCSISEDVDSIEDHIINNSNFVDEPNVKSSTESKWAKYIQEEEPQEV